MLPLVKADHADVVEGPHAVPYHDTAGFARHAAGASRAERMVRLVMWGGTAHSGRVRLGCPMKHQKDMAFAHNIFGADRSLLVQERFLRQSPLQTRYSRLARGEAGAHLIDLEQLEVQWSWPAGHNPVIPALLAGIHNQDENGGRSVCPMVCDVSQ
jgi:hypothetical protein